MTSTEAKQATPPGEPIAAPAPRKFKASDLPLPSATRAAIETLAHSFKKEGAYDSIRKSVWEKFEASVGHSGFGTKPRFSNDEPSRTTKLK